MHTVWAEHLLTPTTDSSPTTADSDRDQANLSGRADGWTPFRPGLSRPERRPGHSPPLHFGNRSKESGMTTVTLPTVSPPPGRFTVAPGRSLAELTAWYGPLPVLRRRVRLAGARSSRVRVRAGPHRSEAGPVPSSSASEAARPVFRFDSQHMRASSPPSRSNACTGSASSSPPTSRARRRLPGPAAAARGRGAPRTGCWSWARPGCRTGCCAAPPGSGCRGACRRPGCGCSSPRSSREAGWRGGGAAGAAASPARRARPAPLLLLSAAPGHASAAAYCVAMKGYAFSPATLTVPAGSTVTWTNQDTAPHDVKTTSGPVSIHSPMLNKGQSWSFTFTTAGSYGYYCTVHPDMTAGITVQAAPTSAAPTQRTRGRTITSPGRELGPGRAPGPGRGTTRLRRLRQPLRQGDPNRRLPQVPVRAADSAPAAAAAPSAAGPAANPQALEPTASARPLDPLLVLAGVVAGVAVLCLLLVGSRSAAREEQDTA